MPFLNPAKEFLKLHPQVKDIDDLIAYSDFLRRQAGIGEEIPVDLEKIFQAFFIPSPVEISASMQAGIWDSEHGIIFVNKDDKYRRARFSKSHELFEFLFLEVKRDFANNVFRFGPFSEKAKEYGCERGASELLIPRNRFFAEMKKRNVSMQTAEDLADLFDVSLSALLIRIVQESPGFHGFMFSEQRHKPSEKKRRIPEAQLSMFSDELRTGPEQKLRVAWAFSNKGFIPRDKSIPPDSSIYESWLTQKKIVGPRERYDLGSLKGLMRADSLPFTRDGKKMVVTLLHLSGDSCSEGWFP